ncbi:peptidase S8 [Micromonospora fluostatini]|uniref:Peptidase S8 n=1 Tax=Micromonospora fluostatini TaxID=1629071 RepID=A0ABY2DJR4_9ACTN|nr:peptidase S8 [Micromonospora fluostatini]
MTLHEEDPLHRKRRSIAAALVLGLALGVPAAASAAPAASPGQPGAAPPAGTAPATPARPATVTLITGDRVTLHPTGALAVRPADGRDKLRFLIQREAGRVSVLPQDALPLIRTGKVDRRLFDITTLVDAGYDDARRDDLPLLLEYRSDKAARRSVAALGGVRVTRDLPVIGGAAVRAAKDEAGAVWATVTAGPVGARSDTAEGVDRIWLDGRRRLTLDHSVAQIGAPAAHQAGWTGRGVSVAVLDTGVDATHPDLVGRVAESRNFSEVPEPGDTIGHGTHVASTIAGTGAASGGKYRGVAPEATLLSGKVCESNGCSESAILAGMQWAAEEKRATVVNVSLGGWDTPEVDPLEEAVETLTASTGTLFVISAGNDGSDGSVGSPGSADAALTVGAVDRDDELADFSSRGPRVGDDALKPDITAPGVEIVAARGAGTTLGTPVGDGYVTASGTSMSAPHVAGAVALLAQQHPDWRAAQLKATLTASARPHPELTAYQQGAGRVDVARAIGQSVTSDPASVSFGRTEWPHGDDEPITRTVTWRNAGTTPLTLDLATEITGPDGAAPPAGMFTLSASRVTVPAGGSAEVTVTADTSVPVADGHWTGRIVASSGDVRAVTPLAVHREVESYPVTVRHLDTTGAPATEAWTTLVGLDTFVIRDLVAPDGTASLRLPKGRYGLVSYVFEYSDEVPGAVSALAQPELVVDGPTELTVDARVARPVRLSVPEPSAEPGMVDLGANFLSEDVGYGFSLGSSDFTGLRSGHLGRRVPAEQFVGTVGAQWLKPDVPVSPYLYAVSEAVPGRYPTGFVKDYRQRDLAKVVHTFRGGDPALETERVVFGESTKYPTGASGLGVPVTVPGQRVEYHNTNGQQWFSLLLAGRTDDDGRFDYLSIQESTPTVYRPARTYRDTWNAAPYGPSLPAPRWPGQGVTRTGDELTVDLPVHSDQAGHAGYSLVDTARTALYRDGTLVAEYPDAGYGQFTVPAGAAAYRLEVSAERSFTDLSTRVDSTWTFRSGHVPGTEPAALPVSAVRFRPPLRVDNSAPAGLPFAIPVEVQRQPGAPAATVTALTVQLSYDGGKTWRTTPVQRVGTRWVAAAWHPAGPGHVSLRATARDSAGNTVTQQIIQAYRLR